MGTCGARPSDCFMASIHVQFWRCSLTMNSRPMQNIGVVVFAVFAFIGCSTTQPSKGGASAGVVTWLPERDPELLRLLEDRYETTLRAYQTEKAKFENGMSTIEFLLQLSDLVVDAEADLA